MATPAPPITVMREPAAPHPPTKGKRVRTAKAMTAPATTAAVYSTTVSPAASLRNAQTMFARTASVATTPVVVPAKPVI